MIIDKATLEDLVSICKIDQMIIGNDSRTVYLAQAIESNEAVIARIDGISVGFAICDRSFFGCSYISLVLVHPQFRRKGVAKGLIESIEHNLQQEKLFTSTNQSNLPMQKVLESLDYERSGIIENLDDGDPELIYFKRIAPIQ